MRSRTPFIIAALIILGAAYLLFDVRLPASTRFWRDLQNLGHVPLFGMVSIALLILFDKIASRIIHNRILLYFGVFVLSVFLGAFTELVQYFTPRDADINDWIFDIVGAILFLGFYFTIDPKNVHIWNSAGRLLKRSMQIILLAGAFVMVFPQIMLGAAYIERDEAFPVIVAFESSWERKFINMQDAELKVVDAPAGWKHGAEGKVGRITFEPSEYPGAGIYETTPDWSKYGHLSFQVYSEMPDTVSLSVRIDDIHHDNRFEDRYTGRFRIYPGENTVLIPLENIRRTPGGRMMDMQHITHLLIFMVNPQQPRVLYFDRIELE